MWLAVFRAPSATIDMSLSSSFNSWILFSGAMRSEVKLLKKLCDKSSVLSLVRWANDALDTATIRLLARSKCDNVGTALKPWSSSTSIWLWLSVSDTMPSSPANDPRRTLLSWLCASDMTCKFGNLGNVLGPSWPVNKLELRSNSTNDRNPWRWDVEADVSRLFWRRSTFKNGRLTNASGLMKWIELLLRSKNVRFGDPYRRKTIHKIISN